MNKRSLVVISVAIVAIMLALITFLSGAINGGDDKVSTTDGSEVTFTDETVYVFGKSQNTELILSRLALSSSKVILVTDNIVLSNLTGRFILLIDGESFMNTYNYSIAETAEAVRPIILNGTPTIILNRSADFFHFAVPDIDFSEHSSTYAGIYMIPLHNGIKVVPGNLEASTRSFSNNVDEFEQSITAAYNWGARNLDGRSS